MKKVAGMMLLLSGITDRKKFQEENCCFVNSETSCVLCSFSVVPFDNGQTCTSSMFVNKLASYSVIYGRDDDCVGIRIMVRLSISLEKQRRT